MPFAPTGIEGILAAALVGFLSMVGWDGIVASERKSKTLQGQTELKQWLVFYEKFWENKLSILKHIVESPGENRLKLMNSETTEDRKN